jgi:hypothetical protein
MKNINHQLNFINQVVTMPSEWNELTTMTGGKPINIERVRLADSGIAIEGSFTLPPLANLPAEDQIFVMAFVRCHGSLKEMEELFGISYPTVKNRINRIAEQFEFVQITSAAPQEEVLSELERGAISPDEAIRRLSK